MKLQLNGGQRYSFGVFAAAIAAMAFTTTFAGCTKKQAAISPPAVIITDTTHTDTTAPGYKYLALGDSYTIGHNVSEEARFPMQTAYMLTGIGIIVNKPAIIATTGWTTQDLLNGIAATKPAANNDIVSLLIGVNDEYQRHDTVGYRERFTACLYEAIELAAGKRQHVFVLSIPDYSVTPFGQGTYASQVAKEIDQFNAINKSVTNEAGIVYIDVTTISREVKDDPGMISSDGLHPSGNQYRLWALLLAAAIEKMPR